jgi:transposase
MNDYHYIGIDIAKDKFDASLIINNKRQTRTFSNNPQGFSALFNALKTSNQDAWVCMEATGIYGEALAEFLVSKAVRTSVVNPMQIKHFSKAMLQRNKNDTVDAHAIAQYVTHAQPKLYIPKTQGEKIIRELVQMLECLTNQKTRWKNKRHAARTSVAKKEFEKEISRLEKRSKDIKRKIQSIIKDTPELSRLFDLITSITGVGETLALTWIAHLPDIQCFETAKQLAAYIGLSPKQKESGLYKGKTKLSKMGCCHLRKVFYMPALSAKHHNIHLQPFVRRLEMSGHTHRQIVGALMRKLAHLIFGILKSGRPFDPTLC